MLFSLIFQRDLIISHSLSWKFTLITASRSWRFTVWEKYDSIHWVGSWVGPRADMKTLKKRNICFLYGWSILFLTLSDRSLVHRPWTWDTSIYFIQHSHWSYSNYAILPPSVPNIFFIWKFFRNPEAQNILLFLNCYINIYQKIEREKERERERERERENKGTKPYIVMYLQQNGRTFEKYLKFIIKKYFLLLYFPHQKYLQRNLHTISPWM